MPVEGHLRQQLLAWLEFYRELGIEDVCRRPLSAVTSRSSVTAPAERRMETQQARSDTAAPRQEVSAGEVDRRAAASPAPAASGLAARPLSLFEAPIPARARETLEQIQEDLGDCHRCRLAAGRKTIVFGEGNPRAALVFVGEGPGADEDEQGLPFVGRAGQLLNRMLQLINIKRREVYICNIVKCRPPGNRTPERDEIETCSPFLFRQIQTIQPRLVCCLGAPAVRTILGLKEGITKIRGRFFDYGRMKALATVHPAYILRNPREEKILREDFEKIRDFLKSE